MPDELFKNSQNGLCIDLVMVSTTDWLYAFTVAGFHYYASVLPIRWSFQFTACKKCGHGRDNHQGHYQKSPLFWCHTKREVQDRQASAALPMCLSSASRDVILHFLYDIRCKYVKCHFLGFGMSAKLPPSLNSLTPSPYEKYDHPPGLCSKWSHTWLPITLDQFINVSLFDTVFKTNRRTHVSFPHNGSTNGDRSHSSE